MIEREQVFIHDYNKPVEPTSANLARGNLSINKSYDMLIESGFTHKEAFGYIAVIVSHKRK